MNLLRRNGVHGVPDSFYHLRKRARDMQIPKSNDKNHNIAFISIEENILYLMKKGFLVFQQSHNDLNLKLNVDGLPLFKSSKINLWPILMILDNCSYKRPLPLCVFSGFGKPNISVFLDGLTKELKKFADYVKIGDFFIRISKCLFICDTPAKHFIMCVKGHASYHGCSYCRQKGTFIDNSMVFSTNLSNPRENQSYIDFKESNQISISPLSGIVNFVTNFPVDTMHAVYLGVMKKLMLFYFSLTVKRTHARVSNRDKQQINNQVSEIRKYFPCEFRRKIRHVDDVEHFKASEFRTFLLYAGPVLFRDVFSEQYFNHFLYLHFAIFSFSSPEYCVSFFDQATYCLQKFVSLMPSLFYPSVVSYNVHALLHIPQFVRQYGSLENFSAFPFENYLGVLKRRIRGRNHIFTQSVNSLSVIRDVYACFLPHNLSFSINCPNNFALTKSGIVLITQTVSTDHCVSGHLMTFVKNLYSFPYSSSSLNIGYYQKSCKFVCEVPLSKCIAFPIDDLFLIFPYANSHYFG